MSVTRRRDAHLLLKVLSASAFCRALIAAPLLAFALLVLTAAPTTATGPITVGGGSFVVAPGSAFTFDIEGDTQGQVIGSFSITVEYNPAVLDAVSCQSATSHCNKDAETGVLIMNGVSLAGLSGEVLFGTVVFDAVGGSGSQTAIDLDVTTITDTLGFDLSGNLSVIDGRASVQSSAPDHPYGDANCDSTVDASDGLAILGDIAGASESACVSLGDFNCDDRLDVVDVLDILRAEGGLPLNFPPDCPSG